MHEKERLLFEQRIVVFIKRLKSLFYEENMPLQVSYRKFEGMVLFEEGTKGEFLTLKKGEVWGSNWERAWFHLSGEVPAEWTGKHVIARIDLGGEGLVFSADGTPVNALSVHTIWPLDEFCRDRLNIAEKATGQEKVDLWIEASAGELFGLKLEVDSGNLRPERFGNHTAKLNYADLAIFREDIWQLYLDCFVLNDQMLALPEKSVRRARILRALSRAIDLFKNTDAFTVKAARDLVAPELVKPAAASDLKTCAVGHAHIDTAWLWPLEETIRKCARTFAVQIDLINRYPGYVFGASQPQHYAFVKKYYPGLYDKIKQNVAEGRWEPQGGMWVEADCNIISGESMVRQILHGKRFFMEEFGVEIKNLWLPDVFGYSAALPQILRKSGIEIFLTQKLSWNQFNKMPHHTFIWRGIDGSEVVTHFPPEDNYNCDLRPSKLMYAQENFNERAFLDEFMTLFGVGDGGGGATEEIMETGLRAANLEACPKVEFGPAQNMFDRLLNRKHLLPRWVGELYLELHRGTLTTQAYNKKMNRHMELALRRIEILFASLPLENYPGAELDAIWKKVLQNQFHDIIPGSSIPLVYEQCRRDYEALKTQTETLVNQAGNLLFDKKENSLVVVNTLSFSYKRPVELPETWAGYEVLDAAGTPVLVQAEKEKPVVLIEISPLSSVTLHRGKQISKNQNTESPAEFVLENEFIRYEFSENGTIARAFDKQAEKEILPAEQFGNVLSLYEDRPNNWDAWDVDIFYENQLIEYAQLESQKWICIGPVRQGIELTFSIGNSKIIQQVFLSANSKRLDFVTDVDWQEMHKMLRVAFPVDVQTDFAAFEIQYGHVKRPTHRNTSWDMAKFEVAGHRFADLSDRDYGAALLNDCKYGYKVLDNVLDLNLLRAPTMPDPKADVGQHQFTYSFLPHTGEFIESNVLKEAAQLNQAPAVFENFNENGFKMPVSLDSEKIILEVIKKAETEDALILRLYEPFGKKAEASLKMNLKNVEVFETDLMERNIQSLDLNEDKLNLQFDAFEIKTIKVKF